MAQITSWRGHKNVYDLRDDITIVVIDFKTDAGRGDLQWQSQ
jgi:hypothetical protein